MTKQELLAIVPTSGAMFDVRSSTGHCVLWLYKRGGRIYSKRHAPLRVVRAEVTSWDEDAVFTNVTMTPEGE